jgi:tricorn protease
MRIVQSFVVLIILFISIPILVKSSVDTKDTRFLSQPAISQKNLAFIYAGDLWISDLDGKNTKRLTSDEGIESDPVFSPDGKLIAFSAQYDGNTDVFIIPVEGGIPQRLTWHPGSDYVCDFTPDGKAVLFMSQRYVFTRRYLQLFTVPVMGGLPTLIKIPHAADATYAPDGSRLAYNPNYEVFRQWKNYRGGTVSTIWLYTFGDQSVVKIPQPDGRCNDVNPMWVGDKVYFLSDRNGEFNLFEYGVISQKIEQRTQLKDFPILSSALSGQYIVYEQAGYLNRFDLSNNQSEKLTISIATDLPELRERYVDGTDYVRSASVSPSGARAVFDVRGDIITMPAKKGDPRNLTNTTGVHERYPAWSPDGKTIAYISDESGENELHVSQQDGKGKVKKIKINGSGFYSHLVWSPDSKKLTLTDNARTLYWINVSSGKVKKIDAEKIYHPGPYGNILGVWSGDSKWIAYTVNTEAYIESVYLYSIDEDKSYLITDGLSDVSEPIFDKSGKYLYFFASTDAGPVKHWFALSNRDVRMTRSIYLATLQKDVPSPLKKETDEEEGTKDEIDEEKEEDEKLSEEPVRIELEGIENRIISLPVDAGNYFNLQAGDEEQIYYLESPAGSGPYAEGTKLHHYNLKEREDKEILKSANYYELSADSKKLLYRNGSSWKIVDASGSNDSETKSLNLSSVRIHIEPQQEWNQIFDEAWRINRDYFYASNMHGTDWKAMRDKYKVFLPHLSSRRDLNRLIQWMCSELAVGHHRVGGGDTYQNPDRIPGGLLGADYAIENNRYRFKKIYGGLNWNPDLRSPLTEPGVNVKEGEYLLAVNGKELTSTMNIYSLFENTSDKIVEITIGPSPDLKNIRVVQVVPVSNESALRNRDWVEGNINKVDQATGGRVAYVYVPNTSTAGHTYFKRYFFSQVQKEAVIIDERFNGGGMVADYYIDILRRPFVSMWNTRYGQDFKTPSGSIQGPKVMLINENAGSGGDLLPWMFRKFKLGKLIGKRTWGGLVGTLGFPTLIDGGYVTAPNLAFWTEEGWIVENEGVPPDIEVEQWPAEVNAGRDPQLEKAIEVILEELVKNPPKKLERPSYPVRVLK